MDKLTQIPDEREILVRAIDLLSMDVLRLKSENETLKMKIQALQKGSQQKETPMKTYQPETIWTKALNYYRREGFSNTVKKIFAKLSGK